MEIDQHKAIPSVVTMKLDSEDYENIYLRVRGKMWKQVAAAIAFVGLGVAGAGWLYIGKLSEKAINLYVESEVFKEGVRADAMARLSELETRSKELDRQISEQELALGVMARLPIAASANNLNLIDTAGRKFSIEMGTVEEGEPAVFKNTYSTEPMVLVSLISDEQKLLGGAMAERGGEVFGVTFTQTGFLIPSEAKFKFGSKRKYRWIAIGG